jgi:isopenicillin-N epimerase
VDIPLPIRAASDITTAILAAVSPRTKLVVVDHVSSPTALIFPVEPLIRALSERGIDTLVDGAHAPGMLDLDIERLGAAYYAGNCHKWMCAPKGAGFLYVREDRQRAIRPLSISHGANATRTDRSRFLLEFDWTGTSDFSPYLTIPSAIRTLAGLAEGGWPEIQRRNRALALEAQRLICSTVEARPICPESMIGSIAAMALPEKTPASLQAELFKRFRIEVPIMPWPTPALRVSAQIYNDRSDYEKLAEALKVLL